MDKSFLNLFWHVQEIPRDSIWDYESHQSVNHHEHIHVIIWMTDRAPEKEWRERRESRGWGCDANSWIIFVLLLDKKIVLWLVISALNIVADKRAAQVILKVEQTEFSTRITIHVYSCINIFLGLKKLFEHEASA